MDLGARLSVVVLTYNRRERVLQTLERLRELPERCPVVVVDNGSSDGTVTAVRRHFPGLRVVALTDNRGAAARNAAVREVRTTYVAFCDDDTWWAPGSLARAVQLLDAYPHVALLSARVLVGPDNRDDPACVCMQASRLRPPGLPGPALLGFLAGACVVRRQAFLQAGGYEARLFLGGEENLLALDLAARGWWLVYAHAVTAHHHPAPRSDTDRDRRRRMLARNAIWVAWMRRPVTSAVRETRRVLHEARAQGDMAGCLRAALRGLPWALRRRRVLPAQIERMRRELDADERVR
jgi:GT2 family glycosyltransferase